MNDLKSKILKLKNDPLARGAAILFVGSFAVNIASYIFNLIVGRMLGPIQYGEYLSLVTIVYLLSVPFSPAQTIVVKYVSQLRAENQLGQIKKLLIMMTKYIALLTVVVTIGILIASPLIQSSLKIDSSVLIVLTALTFASFNPPSILLPAFNGLERFLEGVWLTALGIVVRIVLSVVFIKMGWGVAGVFGALIVGSLTAYIISWEVLYRLLAQSKQSAPIEKIRIFFAKLFGKSGDIVQLKKEIYAYTVPVSIATIGIAALTQLDIILVKTLFSPYEAGIYGSLAIIGKVIPFFSIPLISAMFPQLVARVTRGEDFLKPFYAVLGIIVVFSLGLSIGYFLFPELVINIFFGSKYLAAAPYIGLFGLFQTTFTVMNTFVNFFLAIGKNNLAMHAIGAVIMQVIGISLFHNSLTQVIQVSAVITGIFVLYYSFCTLQLAYNNKKEKL